MSAFADKQRFHVARAISMSIAEIINVPRASHFFLEIDKRASDVDLAFEVIRALFCFVMTERRGVTEPPK